MRVLLVLMIVALAFAPPTVAAEEGSGTTAGPSATSTAEPTNTTGPEPTGCRPYCAE